MVLGLAPGKDGNSIKFEPSPGGRAAGEGRTMAEESVDGPFPNTRGTMYYQLKAFASEVRAQQGLPLSNRARPDTYTHCRLCCPADAVANMAVIDATYRAAGLQPRPSLPTAYEVM